MSTVQDAPATKKKKEKITKEAQELMDVFDLRENGDSNAPNFIVAQIAPSVR